MNWPEEFWIKLYRRASPSFLSMTWQARGLFRLVITEVDPLGRLELGKMGLKAVAVSVRAPWVEIQPYVQECIDDGCLALSEDGRTLSCPNFVEAQEAAQSGKARSASYRAKHKARDADVTNRCADETECGESATARNATQRDETARNDQSRSDQSRPEEKTDTTYQATGETPLPVAQPGDKPSRKPSQSKLKFGEKPAKQPKPNPVGDTLAIWRPLYHEHYGVTYNDGGKDTAKASEYHAKAKALAAELAPNEPDGWRSCLAHWMRAYLANPGNGGYYANASHPLRLLDQSLNDYGNPWETFASACEPEPRLEFEEDPDDPDPPGVPAPITEARIQALIDTVMGATNA